MKPLDEKWALPLNVWTEWATHPDPPEEFPVNDEPEVLPFPEERDPTLAPELLPDERPEITPNRSREIPETEE